VPENLTLSINAPSSMKMIGITSRVFGTALFMIHTGVFVEFQKRGVPQLMLAFVFGIAVFSHHQFITGGTHPWLETTSAGVVGFLTPVRILQGFYASAMLLLALASFRARHEQ